MRFKRYAAALGVGLAAMLALTAAVPSGATAMTLEFQQQQQTATPTDAPVLLASANNLNILAGGSSYTTDWIDVRAYASYSLRIALEGGTLLNTDTVEVDISFGFEPLVVPTRSTYFDAFQIGRTDLSQTSQFRLTDLVKGGWMRLDLFETSGVNRNTNLTYELWGSFRDVPESWLRGHFGNVLWVKRDVLAGGAVQPMALAKIGYGRAVLGLRSGAGGGATMTIQYGNNVVLTETLVAGAANTFVTKEVILPKRIARVTITNNGGALNTIDSFIIQEGYPQ